jgi:acylphosphatase
MPTIHLLIKGDVQGVFYRASAKKIADDLGVKGWIKNTREGNVEALISGEEEQLNKFKAWCRNGPSKATVTGLDETKHEEVSFGDFSIIRE